MLSLLTSTFSSRVALAILAGVLNVVVFPKCDFSVLAWCCLVPLLLAIDREKSMGRAFLLGWGAGAIFFAGACYWITTVLKNYGELGWPGAASVFCLLVLYLASFYGLFAFFYAKVNACLPRQSWWLAPALWVATEYGRTHLLTGFPWCLLGYSLINSPQLTPIATVTGVYGLAFLLVMVNAILARLIEWPSRRSWLCLGGVLVILFVFNFPWLPPTRRDAMPNRARIVQTNIRLDQDWSPNSRSRLLNALSNLSLGVSPQYGGGSEPPVTLILWPETPTPFYFNHDFEFREQLEHIAKVANAYFLFGFVDFREPEPGQSDGLPVNSLAVLSPSGLKLSQYDKVHLVPFGEYIPYPKLFFFVNKISTEAGNFIPGGRLTLTTLDNKHSVGAFICYEAIFPDLVRRFALEGADVLVNVTNDAWFGDSAAPLQHFNMARMRAIENRRYLLRAANDGISAVVSPYGEVLYTTKRFERTAIEGGFAWKDEQTFYTRFGDVFSWMCLGISVMAITFVEWKRRKERTRSMAGLEKRLP
ncbi:MAG: apolipoprotein N-acyltransferase [Terriglobia bacterium]